MKTGAFFAHFTAKRGHFLNRQPSLLGDDNQVRVLEGLMQLSNERFFS